MENHVSVKKHMSSAIVVSALVLLTAVVSNPAHAYVAVYHKPVNAYYGYGYHHPGYGAHVTTVHHGVYGTTVVHRHYYR